MATRSNPKETQQSRKSLIGFAVALILGAGLAVYLSSTTPTIGSGEAAPEFELPSIDGQTHRLSELRGKVVVLDFWSSSCPPCLREMQVLESLHRRLDQSEVAIVGINVEGAPADFVQRFVRERGVGYTILLDRGRVSQLYHVEMLPTLYLIDPRGNIRWSGVGYVSESALSRLIQQAR